jgi:hypothetical protein
MTRSVSGAFPRRPEASPKCEVAGVVRGVPTRLEGAESGEPAAMPTTASAERLTNISRVIGGCANAGSHFSHHALYVLHAV